jgi:hypothetical protein
MMKFPNRNEFFDFTGLLPVEEDATSGYRRYLKISKDDECKIDISFSATASSFQVKMERYGAELLCLSSEQVSLIELRDDLCECEKIGSGLRVVLDISGVLSQLVIMLEPVVYFRWWVLSN